MRERSTTLDTIIKNMSPISAVNVADFRSNIKATSVPSIIERETFRSLVSTIDIVVKTLNEMRANEIGNPWADNQAVKNSNTNMAFNVRSQFQILKLVNP